MCGRGEHKMKGKREAKRGRPGSGLESRCLPYPVFSNTSSLAQPCAGIYTDVDNYALET